ncbi:MAG: hypothetical protein AAF376_18120 [Pseudomonadota bacterium]
MPVIIGPLDVSVFVPDDAEEIVSAASELLSEATSGWARGQKEGVEQRAMALAADVQAAVTRFQSREIDKDWAERILRAARNSYSALALEEAYIDKVARRRLRDRIFRFLGLVVEKFIGFDLLELFRVPPDS